MQEQLWAWAYFVSFVIMGTFIISLFIAMVINNLEESRAEQLAVLNPPVSRDDLLKELVNTQQAISRLQKQIEKIK